MSALKAFGLRLGAVWVLLAVPLAAQAALHLEGPSDWYRGESITIELKADAGTVVNSLFFATDYTAFTSILEINNDPTTTLPATVAAGGPCNRDGSSDLCVLTYPFTLTVVKDVVIAQWEFHVMEHAPIGSVTFDYDKFFIEADTGPIGGADLIVWPDDKQFQVLAHAIPETSSWILMLAGLAAVGASAYSRRMAA